VDNRLALLCVGLGNIRGLAMTHSISPVLEG
jgi:hypothetical protein